MNTAPGVPGRRANVLTDRFPLRTPVEQAAEAASPGGREGGGLVVTGDDAGIAVTTGRWTELPADRIETREPGTAAPWREIAGRWTR
ncbi:hypothetical protein [Streptosporangium sp. NPDC051022]|uniref:hypothetical protein n=1 Tax=Streptosporangium sp. NPDC051022 TaxID=3155752 RepID=UPI00341C36D7